KRLKHQRGVSLNNLYFTIKEFRKRLKLDSCSVFGGCDFTIKEFRKRLKHGIMSLLEIRILP
ncbi:hypothetical protein, partial [Helicobacter ganmani]|uniref:hypothetical protein n=1 Tax=Helicobacter ganmani TaxID=60246 RepID=UPI003A86CB6F